MPATGKTSPLRKNVPKEKGPLPLGQRLRRLLELPAQSEVHQAQLAELGVPLKNADLLDVVLAGIIRAAMGGSVPAFKELRELLGGDENVQQVYQRLDQVLAALESSVQDTSLSS